MSALEAIAACSAALYLAFAAAERALLGRARRGIGTVIHVNGTRGKSETARLVAAALRAGGLRTVAKTTGTEPRLILPDGSERVLSRLGAANVREQRNLMFRASRMGANAVVAECMAVSPDAQAASTAFLSPSILVVTNSRPDHRSELGDPAEAARVFAEGIPRGGVVVTSDPSIFPLVADASRAVGARAVLAAPLEGTAARFPENAGSALEAALAAGVPREAAISGMSGYLPDPGAACVRDLPRKGGGALAVVDALAANDVESTSAVFALAESAIPGFDRAAARNLLVLCARPDRPDRSRDFARWAAESAARWDAVLVAGPLPLGASRELRAAFTGEDGAGRPRLRRLGVRALLAALSEEGEGAVAWAAGNWKGLGPALAAAAPEATRLGGRA